jgi:hypothetical protein
MSYTTLEAVRAQGYTDPPYGDDEINEAIEIACDGIDRITGQFFESREETRTYDGNGTRLLVLDVPLLSLTTIEIQHRVGVWTPYDERYFALYAHYSQRDYPKIEIRHDALFGLQPAYFPKGPQNIRINGTWGYLDRNDETPSPIRRAALELATTYLGTLASGEPQESGRVVIEEETDDHRVKFSDVLSGGKLTGIPSVDRVLTRFRSKSGASHV